MGGHKHPCSLLFSLLSSRVQIERREQDAAFGPKGGGCVQKGDRHLLISTSDTDIGPSYASSLDSRGAMAVCPLCMDAAIARESSCSGVEEA